MKTNLDYIIERAISRGQSEEDITRINHAFEVGEFNTDSLEVLDDVFVHNGWVFYTVHTHTEFKFHCDYFAGYHGTNTIEEMKEFIDNETL